MLNEGGIQGEGFVIYVVQKNRTPPIHAFDALKIIKNGIELRKLWPPKVKGVKNSKKQTTKHYKS